MSQIGKVISVPGESYQWGRFKDEYGNHWNLSAKNIPEDTAAGDRMAYRLDFSDTRTSPQIVFEEDDS